MFDATLFECLQLTKIKDADSPCNAQSITFVFEHLKKPFKLYCPGVQRQPGVVLNRDA